jgi:sporulation protein YunB
MRLGLSRRYSYFPPRRRRQFHFGVLLCLVMVFFIVGCMLFFTRIRPAFYAQAQSYANNLATDVINDSVNRVFSSENISYQDIVTIMEKEGEISAVEANVSKMNQLKSEITKEIQTSMESGRLGTIQIPFGSVLESELFSGMGPMISVKLAPASTTQIDFTDTFQSAGINQVRHQVFLDITLSVKLAAATMDQSETVHTTVPVAETVIVGKVPNYYGATNGLSITAGQE